MKLTIQDVDIFFRLMVSLQLYVNLKLGILPQITAVEEYQTLTSRERIPVRDALYDNIELIDSYLQKNPHQFPKEELEIIKSWKRFIRGEFFIERSLKKYTVFIGNENVYGVLALYKSFEEVLSYVRLPYYTQAVLLPFKGKIIYDGILQGYSISFGGGMRSDLKETYMTAKQNGRIIDSFEPVKRVERKKSSKDWRPIVDEISLEVKKFKSSSGAPPIQSPAFSLVRASIEFTKTAVHTPDDLDELWKSLKRVERALRKAETTLFRADDY